MPTIQTPAGEVKLPYTSHGAVGRIHIDYSVSYTGTTTPTIDATLDTTIVPVSAGGAWFMFM